MPAVMILPIKRMIVLAIATCFGDGNAFASRPGHDLESLVSDSDIVVFGTVEAVSNSPVAVSGREKIYSSTMVIEECFKRTVGAFSQVGPRLKYMFLTGGPEDPSIRAARRYVLFLKDSDIGPYPLDGLVGVVPVDDGNAKTAFIDGEPSEQVWNSFEKRVRAYSLGFGCT